MPRGNPKQWMDLIAVIRNSHRADCGHPAGTDLFRFRKDVTTGEVYSQCAHCAAAAETQGLTVYRFRPGQDTVPFAMKRIELS